MSMILMLGVNSSAVAQEIEFCGEFHKDTQPSEEYGTYSDRFGNQYLPSELAIPNNGTVTSPFDNANTGFSDCSCSDLEIETGIFELWFEDCDLGTGIGFDHPITGKDRRIVICNVYKELNELLIPNQTSCNAGNTPIVNVRVIPSHTDDGGYYGNDLSPLGSTTLGVGSGFNSGTPIKTTLPWRIINLGEEILQLYHSYIRFNFDADFIWYTGPIGDIQNSPAAEVDLRSVALHEALHTLGFASSLEGSTSRFDLHLHLTNYPNIGELQVFEYNNTTGFNWDLHDMIIPSDLHSSCQNPNPNGPDLVFRTGVNDVPVYTGSSPNPSSFSHLNISCDGNTTSNFVMHPFLSANVERYITQEEKEILSTMGYRVVGASSDNCEVFALDDGNTDCSPFFTVPVCESITISVAALLANDLNATGIVDIRISNTMDGIITNTTGLPLGTGDSFVFTPNQFGIAELQYVPIGCNGEIGQSADVTIMVVFGLDCPNLCTAPIDCLDQMGYEYCEIFDDCDLNEDCNIICNPNFCGTLFSQTPINQPIFGVVDEMYPNQFIDLPGWEKTHGTPDFGLPPALPNNSGSIRLVSGIDISEGIFSGLTYESGDYLFSIYYEEQENNSIDNITNFFVVDVIQTVSSNGAFQLIDGGGFGFNIPTYTGPSETTLIQQEFELHSLGFSRVGNCTNVPAGYDALWIYTDISTTSSEDNINGVYLDGLELVKDEFSAGENITSAQCYDPVILGNQFCMLSDVKVKYDWKNSEGQIIASYEVLNGVISNASANVDVSTHTITVNPLESTTYTLCRTILDYGGLPNDFAFCSETDEVAVTVLDEFPDADFTYEIDEENCKIYFFSNSSIAFHEWDFGGDGIPDSTDPNPFYCFEEAGSILVSHLISNDCGMEEATQTIQLPDCTPEPPSGCDCPANSVVIPPNIQTLSQAVYTSTFNRNFVGIHADGDFTLDPFYGNTFDCSPASLLPFFPNQPIDPNTDISYTGLDWNNGVPQFVGFVINNPIIDEILRNHFRNMRNGIIADNISLNVINSDFSNMTYSAQYPYPLKGNGIYINDEDYSESLYQRGYGINGDLTFDNCRSGISTRRVGVNIANNNMQDCAFGISATQAIGRDVEIKRNKIGCFSRGINLLHNNVATKILVEFNIINLDDIYLSARAIGINLVETNNAAQPDSKIKNNEVNIHNGARGIAAIGTNKTLIDDNLVTATADFNISYPYHGIDIRNSIKCDVSCNQVFGNLNTISFSSFQNKGIRVDGTTQTFVSCNTLRNHHVGMQFIGECSSPDQVRGNTFEQNFDIGLHYFDTNLSNNLFTITGLQDNRGNRWTGNFSNWGAFHNGGTFQAFQSIYEVSGTNNPFHPGTVNPFSWFDPNGQGEGYSCDGGECPDDEEKVKEYDKSIANNDGSLSELPVMNQHLMKRYLLRKINANPDFTTEETDLQNFKVAMENTVAGRLHQIEQTIGDVLKIEETHLSDLANLSGKMQTKREEILAIDAQYFQAEGAEAENLLIERNQLLAALNSMKKNYNDVMASVLTARASKIQNAQSAATEVNTEQIWQTNELEMLTTSLELLSTNGQASGQILNNLSFLSEECVGEEGYAVYDAQSLLAYFTDDYWKDGGCSTPQPQGLVGQINNSHLPQADVKVFPNPVNTSLTIQYNLSEKENYSVYLRDITGQIKSEIPLQENSGSLNLKTEQFANGFYWLVIQNNRREKVFSEKLIIVH